ncbi:MAG TPA: wax ester/triacylglycerol synthase family O-acyltransferase, partial [Calditrichia bacterium]|nr:wax ester/triacylglycerol synthase family O-acyltransferase [Calditrichia bacterium]
MGKNREPMSNVDTAWLRMDHPTNLMIINGILIFEERLDMDRLRRLLEERFLTYKRFRQKVVRHAGSLRNPDWVDDENFDLDNHLIRLSLEPGGNLQKRLQERIGQLMSEDLDPDRPLWQFYLLDIPGDECVVICRMHHCIADGTALVRVMLSLTDEAANGGENAGSYAQAPSGNAVQPRSSGFFDPIVHAAEKTWQVGVNLFKQGKYVVTHPQLLAQAAKMGARGVSTLGKLAFGPSDPPTRFKGPLTRNKLGVWSRPVSLDAVKTIGRATGSTVNDVLFTAMLGGLRRYLEMHGENTRDLELRATVPVNLRDPERALELGNHFGLVFPALPVGVIDPLERIRLMREEMNRIKSSPEAMITLGALHAAAVAPQDIQDLVVNFLGSKTSAVMTNVPGPRQKLFLAGAPLKHIIFWVPQSGRVGMGISIFSYAGEVIMGIAADTGLVPDPENIIEAFHQEFDMLLEQARNLSNDPQT